MPGGPGLQSQAAHAEWRRKGFKQAPACNMDETGACCSTFRGTMTWLDLTLSFPHVSERYDHALHFGQVELSRLFLHSSLNFPPSSSPPLALLQTVSYVLTFTVVFHFIAV